MRTSFTVKAMDKENPDKLGSTADISSKTKKGSLTSLNKAVGNFGGSLLSLGQKERQNIKKLAKSVSHKVEKAGNKARKSLSSQHKEQAEGKLSSTGTILGYFRAIFGFKRYLLKTGCKVTRVGFFPQKMSKSGFFLLKIWPFSYLSIW